jgi:hypothetical protein
VKPPSADAPTVKEGSPDDFVQIVRQVQLLDIATSAAVMLDFIAKFWRH